jgi:hypothetical protein
MKLEMQCSKVVVAGERLFQNTLSKAGAQESDPPTEITVSTHNPLVVGRQYTLTLEAGRVSFEEKEVQPLLLPHAKDPALPA